MRRLVWLLLALPACTVEEGPPSLVTTTADAGALDRFFEISKRGSTVGTELRVVWG